MQRDFVFYDKYSSVVEKYGIEGLLRQVFDDEFVKFKLIWYFFYYVVWYFRKLEEFRVVFDCVFKSGGILLNEELLCGLENISSLIGVIFRFRVNEVVVIVDIKRMFYQVYVILEDCGVLCYLWWFNGDILRELKIYQMFVYIFGVKFLLSVVGYVFRKIVKDNE